MTSIRSTRGIRIIIVALVILAAYAWLYTATPLPGDWNDIATTGLTILAALMGAIFATLVYRAYPPGDAPRRVWLWFMLGVWMWVAAEAVWGYYYLTAGEIATPSLADLLWVAGYAFFTLAFYHQYRLCFQPGPNLARLAAVGVWLATLAATYLLTLLMGVSGSETFITYFYPVADLMMGLFALHLLWTFRGAAMAWPWLGMFVFTFADLAYAWAEQSGLYAWSLETGNAISLAVDLSYVAAYLIMAIGIANQYMLIRYGAYTVSEELNE
jgi:hypothetical protein